MTERSWLSFYIAVNEIEQRLGVSGGVASRKLRDACASGDVRSQRQPYNPATGIDEGPPEPIKPGDWWRDQVDLETDADGCRYFVDVDEADFRYWLNGGTNNNAHRASSRSPKRRWAEQAINKLWPGGIPSSVLNKEIEKEVGKWLKQQGVLTRVSRETILRAAGRK